jgi:Protein of unknown function (DUF4038)/Domain of unknown function (DUF5060)
MKAIKLICLLLLCSVSIWANVRTISQKDRTSFTVLKWEVVDIPFKANIKNITNPFTIAFSANLSGPDNTILTLPAFYNGKGEWIIRLSISKPGNWTYKTSSTVKELNNKMGSFTVAAEAEKGQHGGLIIDPKNPQRFVYEDGTPYFLLAYECDWLYALDYDNQKAAPKTEQFLDLIANNGCSYLVMNLFTYDVSWPKDKKLKEFPQYEYGGSKTIFPFLGNNDKPDFSALNPEFFKKMDRTISLMNDKNLVSHLMIYVWNKLVNWPGMNTIADNMYFDYVVKRYQAFPNIVFDISKEALAYGRADDQYIKERIERLRKMNSYNRLVTVHDYAYCKRNPATVDFIAMQSWSSTIYNLTLNTVNEFPNKPVFNIEHGGYEESPFVVWTGSYTDAEVCLRRNYHIIFGGAYSSYYWQGCSWNVLIHNPFDLDARFTKPKFEYYKHLQDFFKKQDFFSLKPDPEKNRDSYILSDSKDKYLFYVSKDNYMIQPNFLKKTALKRSYTWFNTLTGEYIKLDQNSLATGDKKIISDWQSDIHLESPWRGKADAILITELIEN